MGQLINRRSCWEDAIPRAARSAKFFSKMKAVLAFILIEFGPISTMVRWSDGQMVRWSVGESSDSNIP